MRNDKMNNMLSADTLSISMTVAGRYVQTPLPLQALPAFAQGQDADCSISVPGTDLTFRLQGWFLPECGAAYFVPFLVNNGSKPSELLERICSIDMQMAAKGAVCLHHARGCRNETDDFLPLENDLPPGASLLFEPVGGRSSNGIMPFFNLAWPGGGLAVAVGWTGQWSAAFRRADRGALDVKAGLPYAAFCLDPGESVRLPSILLVPWAGDDWMIGQNALRHVLLDNFCPRIRGDLILPPVAHATAAALHMHDGGWAGGNEKTQLNAIEAIAPLGVEAYWLDAYWFPGNFPNGVGNWFYRAKDFPHGLMPLADAAHGRGMKFILWFEPERVGPDTLLEREHPRWLLGNPGQCRLLNLGLPEARVHMTGLLSRLLSESGADVYRQDFNIDPLPFWQAADTPERKGITEIRHIEGLYAMWDELRSRHAGLWIDNCASGGRRIDIETLSRSLPLWRSDTPDRMIWDKTLRANSGVVDQVQTSGLSLWAPLHSGGVWGMDPYRFRSAMHSGIVLYDDPRQPDFPAEQAATAFNEIKTLRPFFQGDYYLLTPLSTSESDWCAYQYHRKDLDAGFAVFSRRKECDLDSMNAGLRGINPSGQYRVEWREDYRVSRTDSVAGRELLNLEVRIPAAPGCVLMQYAGKTNL